MVGKCLLKILLRGDLLSLLVDQLKGEVPDNPHEGWKILGVFLWVHVILVEPRLFDLDVLGQIDDQREVLEGVLINRSNRVVDEVRREEDSQREDSHVMVGVFIKGAKTFGVHYNNINWVTVWSEALNWLAPHPNTLGARVDGWANSEPVASVK